MKKTCIALDDDPIFIKLVKTYFAEIPEFELIATYTNEIEALMGISKKKPDFVLLDYEMPMMNGLTTFYTMEPRPRVIIISGHLDRPETLDVPADAFISKADLISPEILASTLKRLI